MFLPLRRAATMVLPMSESSKSERETPSMTLESSATTHFVIFLPIQFSSTALLAASTSGSSGIVLFSRVSSVSHPHSTLNCHSSQTLFTSNPARSCLFIANQRFRLIPFFWTSNLLQYFLLDLGCLIQHFLPNPIFKREETWNFFIIHFKKKHLLLTNFFLLHKTI